jgi:hypothetical protein
MSNKILPGKLFLISLVTVFFNELQEVNWIPGAIRRAQALILKVFIQVHLEGINLLPVSIKVEMRDKHDK